MKKAIANILSLMFILVLASCNLPGKAAPEPGTVAPMATSEPVPATAVPTPVPTAIPEPLPSGYSDLLQNKIASGEWTLEVGLVTMLRLFAGEIQASEADLGQGALNTEGTGILLLAGNYLQTGTDQAVKDEITRLINLLVPTQEALDRYSIPEEQATVRGGRGIGLAIPVKSDVEECARLWKNGFPVIESLSFPCFLFGNRNIAGNSYRVYYPLAWHGDESREPFYAATLEAVQDSIALYKKYGTVKPIYFVFTTLDGRFDAFTYYGWETPPSRDAPRETPREGCPVIIHPSAMNRNSIPVFKQLIAHEIFHCFQSWNLTQQILGPGDDSKWWSEGTAEYFSNLVYPAVNSEHQYIQQFSNFSATLPLTNMEYENFAFFQFMGNRTGPRRVIAMLRTMPTTPGRDAQLAALAAVPGMEDTFEEFVRAVMDNAIEDADKSMIEFPEIFTEEVYFSDIESKDFSSQPFVAARYLVSFPSEKSFAVETVSEGPGHSAWRPKELVEGWGPFPATAAGKCEEQLYIGYVITTTPGAERKETVATTLVTANPCDKCLFGRWEATNDSIIAYMQSVAAAGGENVPTVESITGTMFMEFGADSIGSGGYENLKVHETGVGGVAIAEVFVTFDGVASGPYTADGSALTGLNEKVTISVTVQIPSVGSTTVPFKQEDFPVSAGNSTRYTCDSDTLTMWPPIEGATVEPIVYIRTSP